MGTGITVECSRCSFSETFMLGVGMLYWSMDYVIDRIHNKRRGLIREILRNYKVNESEYEHRLYQCKRCNRLYERFYIRLRYDYCKLYETEFKCPKCKVPLEAVDDDKKIGNIPCAHCGHKSLKVTGIICWD